MGHDAVGGPQPAGARAVAAAHVSWEVVTCPPQVGQVTARFGAGGRTAQPGPVLNAGNPDALRGAIKRAYAEMLEKVGESGRGVLHRLPRRSHQRWPPNWLQSGFGALTCDYVSRNHDVRPVEHLHEVAPCDEHGDIAVPRGDHVSRNNARMPVISALGIMRGLPGAVPRTRRLLASSTEMSS